MHNKRYPYMLKFSRDYLSCYIAHLDWIRFLQSALDISKLPLIYTEGYSTKPKLKFSPPLPVGLQSDTELVMIFLRENIGENIVGKSLEGGFPDGIEVLAVKFLHPSPPKNPFHAINGAKYEMRFPGELDDTIRRRVLDLINGNEKEDDIPDDIKKQHEMVVKVLNEDEFLENGDFIDYVARLESGRTFHPVKFAMALYRYLDLPHMPQGRKLSFLNIDDEGARFLFDF